MRILDLLTIESISELMNRIGKLDGPTIVKIGADVVCVLVPPKWVDIHIRDTPKPYEE